jgi:hypothetical protein
MLLVKIMQITQIGALMLQLLVQTITAVDQGVN